MSTKCDERESMYNVIEYFEPQATQSVADSLLQLALCAYLHAKGPRFTRGLHEFSTYLNYSVKLFRRSRLTTTDGHGASQTSNDNLRESYYGLYCS